MHTQVYYISPQQVEDWKNTQCQINTHWLPARDIHRSLSFTQRLHHAWNVLTNRADVLYWPYHRLGRK